MKRILTLSLLSLLCTLAVAMPSHDNDSLDYYLKVASKAYRSGNHRQAMHLYDKAVSFIGPASPYRSTYEYTEMLETLASLKASAGEIDRAIALEEEVIEWRDRNKSDYGVLGSAIGQKALFLSFKKDYNSAIKYGQEAAAMLKRRFGEKSHEYNVNQANLAFFYSLRGESPQDYQTAVRLAEAAVKRIDQNTTHYARAINHLVLYYSQAEQRDKANALSKKALQKGRAIFGKRSRAYADLLHSQAVRLAGVKNYSQSLDFDTEARAIYEADSATNDIRYARILYGIGSVCKMSERFDMGIEALTKAQQVLQLNNQEGTPEYISCVSNLAALYRMKGNLEKADEIAQHTEQLISNAEDADNYLAFGKSLGEQAWMYAANGDFNKAIDLGRRALTVFTENKDTVNMAVSMGDLSSHYFNSGRHDQALYLCQQSVDVLRNSSERTTALGRSYNNLSIFHYRLGNKRRALELSKQAVRNFEELNDTKSSLYAKILGNLAMFYYVNDSIDMAVQISKRSLDIQSSTLGPEHPDLVVTYNNIANYYLAQGDMKQMRDYFERALEMQARAVRNNFSHLTTSGRELYWNMKSYVFKLAPVLASISQSDDALVCDAYNSLLFTKGILLNSEIDFKNFLMQTDKTELLAKFEELENLHKRIDDYRHSATYDRDVVNELLFQASRLERDVMRGCKEFGDFTSNLSITFEQVADSLAPDAAAIEFVDMPMEGGDRAYAALYLRHGWKSPRMVSLFSLKDLVNQDYGNGRNLHEALATESGINAIYNHPQVGHFVWYKLMEALGDDVNTIYFSPTGILYQLGIEYMKYNMEQRINERYRIHRLSSTKSIAQAKTPSPITSAVVYGGLDYDLDPEEMALRHEQYSQPVRNLLAANDVDNTRSLFSSNSAAIDSLSRAGMNLTYLQGTRKEAQDVADALRSHGIDTKLFLEGDGTEESFKSLSGKNVSIIHIATHGHFFTDSDTKAYGNVIKLIGGESTMSETLEQDRSMDLSVLFMSGANTVLHGRRLPDNVENGVLMAKEISQLDLRGLDLVVLSACQTGKGELREDGVYGLQRAFKKAGAQTLIMSLWSVNDAATQLMMSSFYKALAEGASRYEAFTRAQAEVRRAGFTDPYYWASFIMLDDDE